MSAIIFPYITKHPLIENNKVLIFINGSLFVVAVLFYKNGLASAYIVIVPPELGFTSLTTPGIRAIPTANIGTPISAVLIV